MAAKEVSSGDSVADRESASTTLHRVAGFDRNGWPACVGIGGRLASESVAGLARITHAPLALIGCELRNAVGTVTDAEFIAGVTAGSAIFAAPSSGNDADHVIRDLADLLANIARVIQRRSDFGRLDGATAEKAVLCRARPWIEAQCASAFRFSKEGYVPMSDKARDEDRLDVALEQTFPASDAPFFMAGAAVAGAPRRGAAEPESLKSEARSDQAGGGDGKRAVE